MKDVPFLNWISVPKPRAISVTNLCFVWLLIIIRSPGEVSSVGKVRRYLVLSCLAIASKMKPRLRGWEIYPRLYNQSRVGYHCENMGYDSINVVKVATRGCAMKNATSDYLLAVHLTPPSQQILLHFLC